MNTFDRGARPGPRKLSNRELKDYAITLIVGAIIGIDHPTIVERAENYPDIGAITDFDAHLVQDLIDCANVTISWSEAD